MSTQKDKLYHMMALIFTNHQCQILMAEVELNSSDSCQEEVAMK